MTPQRPVLAGPRLFAVALIGLSALACGSEPARQPSVLLLTLDATRADALGCYDPERGTTPNLDALARESLLFLDAVASTPYTGPAHASILTGLYPPQHGMRDYLVQALPGSADTLAERFRAAGYETAAFVSAYVLAPRFGLNQGFDVYRDRARTSVPARRGDETPEDRLARAFHQRPADATVNDALQWFRARDRTRPFFSWLHFYDPHAPYAPPGDERRAALREGEIASPELERSLYYAEMTFVDAQIGRLLRELETLGEVENLIVAVVGDHGELLGHHGRRLGGHSPELVTATLRVPLFVRVPGHAARVVTPTVRALDLFPTLLEAAGLPVPDGIEGLSLLDVGENDPPRPAYSETLYENERVRAAPGHELVSLQLGPWRLRLRPGRVEVFDRTDDPGELRDLSTERPERVAELLARLEGVVAHWPDEIPTALLELTGPDEEEHLEGLRALGYVE